MENNDLSRLDIIEILEGSVYEMQNGNNDRAYEHIQNLIDILVNEEEGYSESKTEEISKRRD